MRYYRCPDCGRVHPVHPLYAARVSYIRCNMCGATVHLTPENLKGTTKGRTDSQKRSRDQERRAAKRDGGRVQPGSGSMPHAKGDVHSPGLYRMECKETVAKSFSVKRTIIDKITKEASGMETPVLEVEFQGEHPKARFYVIPEWAWKEYMELKNEHQDNK